MFMPFLKNETFAMRSHEGFPAWSVRLPIEKGSACGYIMRKGRSRDSNERISALSRDGKILAMKGRTGNTKGAAESEGALRRALWKDFGRI